MKKYYYVIIEVDPDDCMGNRTMIFLFNNVGVAEEKFKNPFGREEDAKKEYIKIYGWDNEYYSETDDDVIGVVIGEVFLFRFDKDIFELPDMKDYEDREHYDYGLWMNDYNEKGFGME